MNNENGAIERVSVKPLITGGEINYIGEGSVEITLTMDILKKLVKIPYGKTPPNDAELMMFAYTCISQGLNPYLNECWLAHLGKQQGWTPLVAAQSRVRKAQSQSDYDGYEWGWIGNDGTRYKSGLECILSNTEGIIGAWGCIHRKNQGRPFYHEVFLKEYQKLTENSKGSWDNRPLTMLLKVIRDQTHKFAYADKMGNLMTENEAHFTGNGSINETPKIETPKTAALLEEEPKPEPPQEEPPVDDDMPPESLEEQPDKYICTKCNYTFKVLPAQGKCKCGGDVTEIEKMSQTKSQEATGESFWVCHNTRCKHTFKEPDDGKCPKCFSTKIELMDNVE